MEELKCTLLGFGSNSIGVTLSPCLRQILHPTECALVSSALPMASDFKRLSKYCADVVVGKISGMYPMAVASGMKDILKQYEGAVQQLETPADVGSLVRLFPPVFAALASIVSAGSLQLMLGEINRFIHSYELPVVYRKMVGEAVSMSVLYLVAHWAAYGELLRSANEFFVYQKNQAGEAEQFNVNPDLLPLAMATDLATSIFLCGVERRAQLQTKTDFDMKNGDPRRMKMKDVSAAAFDAEAVTMFNSIYNLSLCRDGMLMQDELELRIATAKKRWSDALWKHVGVDCDLVDNLVAIREMFLCHRGDLWHTFVENMFPTLCSLAASKGDVSRSVAEAFRFSVGAVNLADTHLYSPFTLQFDSTSASSSSLRSVSAQALEMGEILLQRIQCVSLNFEAPLGVQLVVKQDAIRNYSSLFQLQLCMKFALHALHVCRRFIGQLSRLGVRSNSSAHLRISTILQSLTFLHTNISFFLQVDVQDVHFSRMLEEMKKSTTVETAQRLHRIFVANLREGCFLVDSERDVLTTLRKTISLSLALYALCSRADAAAVLGSKFVPADFAIPLTHIENAVTREVLPSLMRHLSLSSKIEHTALWTRLDFNRWISGNILRASRSVTRTSVSPAPSVPASVGQLPGTATAPSIAATHVDVRGEPKRRTAVSSTMLPTRHE